MIFEPIELELDKPRKLYLTLRALMRAETEINRLRGAAASERVSIDYLVLKAARDYLTGGGNFPLDVVVMLVWSGLLAVDQQFCEKRGLDKQWINEPLTVDQVLDMIEASPLKRGSILTRLWDHYNEVTTKEKNEDSSPDDEAPGGDDPLAQRPGSSSGPLQ